MDSAVNMIDLFWWLLALALVWAGYSVLHAWLPGWLALVLALGAVVLFYWQMQLWADVSGRRHQARRVACQVRADAHLKRLACQAHSVLVSMPEFQTRLLDKAVIQTLVQPLPDGSIRLLVGEGFVMGLGEIAYSHAGATVSPQGQVRWLDEDECRRCLQALSL